MAESNAWENDLEHQPHRRARHVWFPGTAGNL
jgi:hypothetical protein